MKIKKLQNAGSIPETTITAYAPSINTAQSGQLPGFIRRDNATGNYITAIPRNDKSGRKLLKQWERGDGKQLMRDSSLVRTVNPKDNRYMYVKRNEWLSSGGIEDKNSDEFTSRLKFIGFDGDFYNYYDPETGNVELYDNRFSSGGILKAQGGTGKNEKYPSSTSGAAWRGLVDYVLRRDVPKSFVNSDYRPTIGDNGEEYYTRPELKKEVALNLFGGTDYGKKFIGKDYFYKDFDDAFNKISSHTTNRDMRTSSNGTLGQYSVTTGSDNRGRYLSFTDKFDYVIIPGKPIHIYDRIYEDEVPNIYDASDSAVRIGDFISRAPMLKKLTTVEHAYGGTLLRHNEFDEGGILKNQNGATIPSENSEVRTAILKATNRKDISPLAKFVYSKIKKMDSKPRAKSIVRMTPFNPIQHVSFIENGGKTV